MTPASRVPLAWSQSISSMGFNPLPPTAWEKARPGSGEVAETRPRFPSPVGAGSPGGPEPVRVPAFLAPRHLLGVRPASEEADWRLLAPWGLPLLGLRPRDGPDSWAVEWVQGLAGRVCERSSTD